MEMMFPTTLHSESRGLFNHLLQEKNIKGLIVSLKVHHQETYKHSLRVGLLCIDLGYDNCLNKSDLTDLGFAGLLHDVEKTKIPIEVLSKNGSLSHSEKVLVEQHPRLVFEGLRDLGFDTVREIVVAHHEFQNNPYPRDGQEQREIVRSTPERRKNDITISDLAQIVAVVDMYDALVNSRAYKKGLSKNKTCEILQKQFTGDEKYIKQIIQRYDA